MAWSRIVLVLALLDIGCSCGSPGAMGDAGTGDGGGTSGPTGGGTTTAAGSGSGGESSGGATGGPGPVGCGYAPGDLLPALSLGYVSDVAVADLDGDGQLDLVVCRASPEVPQAVSVLLATGPGTFADPVDFAMPGVNDVELGDFDEDGKLDVLVVGYSSDATLLAHDGSGGLTTVGTVGVGSTNCYDLEVGDLDGDGHLDFATSCEAQETTTDPNEQATAFRGLGDGTFEHYATLAMAEPHGIHLADLDGDDLPELLATSFAPMGTPSFLVYGNTGTDFVLDSMVDMSWGGDIASGDFDGDGDLDVVVGQEWISTDMRGVVAYFENTGGVLGTAEIVDVAGAPFSVEVADFDGDGALDFVATGTDGFVQFGLGGGDGTFTQGSVLGVGDGDYTVKVADFDGDGRPDVVHGAARGLVVRVNAGDGFPPPPSSPGPLQPSAVVAADFDGDGHLDLAGASEDHLQIRPGIGDGTFGSAWEASTPSTDFIGMAAGDIDGDGRLDLVLTAGDVLIARLGNGDGTLGDPQTLDTTPPTGPPRVADVDGDGKDEVIVPRDGGAIVWSSKTQGITSWSVDGIGVIAVEVADVDGDGKLDLLVGESKLHVLPGDGAGSFGDAMAIEASHGAGVLVAADIDGDGDPDVVSKGGIQPAGAIFGGLAWFENRDGVLQAQQGTDPLGMEVHALAAGDLDGDGASDIVTMEDVSMAMSVYAGASGPGLAYGGTYAFTGTGVAAWKAGRPGSVAIADFDEDGTPDVAAADLENDRIVLLRGVRLMGDACQ